MKTATLPIKGLNFAGRAREIEKNLSKLDGIAQVELIVACSVRTTLMSGLRLD